MTWFVFVFRKNLIDFECQINFESRVFESAYKYFLSMSTQFHKKRID